MTDPREMLKAWSAAAAVEGPLEGGNRNRLWAVRIGHTRYAARLSSRPAQALDWEIRLLHHLGTAGMTVPEVVPTRDGRFQVDGLVLFTWMEGHPPASATEWRRAADALTWLHMLTRNWPQRPTFRSSTELLHEDVGGDVHLDLMPADVAERVRQAWRPLHGEPTCVVHGDPGADNIRVHQGRVGFIDWDEARVDAPLFDMAAMPVDSVPAEDQDRIALARRAAIAWEVANGWVAEPTYARRRLEQLDSLPDR